MASSTSAGAERQRLRSLLRRYVNSREKAYQLSRCQSLRRLAPISRIRQRLDLYRNRSLEQHYKLVVDMEADLLAILPGDQSRFQELRETILKTLGYCHRKLELTYA